MNRPLRLPNAAFEKAAETRFRQGFLPRGYCDGLIVSNDGTDATNDIAVAGGVVRSTCRIIDGAASTFDRDQMDLEIPVSIIKQLDTAFAPENYDPAGYSGGGRSGGRSSASLADGTWHLLAVGGGGLQTDILLHNSLTQSSILAEMQKVGGYTAYANIMSIVRATSIKPFTQVGTSVLWTTPVRDVNNGSPGTSANTSALTVPTGLKLWALIDVFRANPGSILVSSLDQDDEAPSSTHATVLCAATSDNASVQAQIRTNTSGEVRHRSSSSQTVQITTLGFWHPRNSNAA